MDKWVLTQALVLALGAATVGCVPAMTARDPIASTTAPGLASGQVIDLRQGMSTAPRGYGLVTLHVSGLPGASGYGTQALGKGAKTLVIRVRSSSDAADVLDVTGNPAIYKATVNGTAATIAFPALPSTSINPADLDTTHGSPYIFQMRCYSASKSFPTAVVDGGATLSAWVNPTDVSEDITDPTILASGESRQNVVAGLPTTVAIQSWAQVAANIDTTSSPAVNQVALSPVPADAAKHVRIRLTGVSYAHLGDPTKTPALATGGFTLSGAPQADDQISVSWTDVDGNVNSASYTVSPTDTLDGVASGIAAALSAASPTGSNYAVSSSGTSVTIASKIKDGIWDASPTGPLTATVKGPPASISAISTVLSGGSGLQPAAGTMTFALANGFAAPQAGDLILMNFQDEEATPHAVTAMYTVTSADTSLSTLAGDIVATLNSDSSFNLDYAASQSGASVDIVAKSDGAEFDSAVAIPNLIQPPGASDIISPAGVVNVGGGEPLTVIRAALTYSAATTVPASWSVSTLGLPGSGPGDGGASYPALTGVATVSVLMGGVALEGSTLLLQGSGLPVADTVQYIDIPVVSSNTDGIWEFDIYDPGSYTAFQAFDLETGRSLSTSVSTQ